MTVSTGGRKMENYFVQLNQINVNEHTEKKGNLTYLSWAWAWQKVKENFPDSTYKIYEDSNGMFYHTDGKTCWVKTGVTVNGIEHIEYLPVMDYKNRSIPLESITSFDVNKAIQRSLTKAVARHGLGLYIYAGEDLPTDEKPEKENVDYTKQSIDKLNEIIITYKKLSGETDSKSIAKRLEEKTGIKITKSLSLEDSLVLRTEISKWVMELSENGEINHAG